MSILWWALIGVVAMAGYGMLEDDLEKTLGLPVIYHRRLSISLYLAIVFTLFFPQTVYDLVMLVGDLVLLA